MQFLADMFTKFLGVIGFLAIYSCLAKIIIERFSGAVDLENEPNFFLWYIKKHRIFIACFLHSLVLIGLTLWLAKHENIFAMAIQLFSYFGAVVLIYSLFVRIKGHFTKEKTEWAETNMQYSEEEPAEQEQKK